ncbi:hypothetical protein Cgig2_027965 [Carnegiea gigantea]|uniref:Uncharacterized protein n=1 Tax=Carnegiea gigantea TaxID=171969 RepID=A0A9Q1JVI4_9CARY|nr:hypothetical protein Cgig2_027965 [Carnegiea gigantea]
MTKRITPTYCFVVRPVRKVWAVGHLNWREKSDDDHDEVDDDDETDDDEGYARMDWREKDVGLLGLHLACVMGHETRCAAWHVLGTHAGLVLLISAAGLDCLGFIRNCYFYEKPLADNAIYTSNQLPIRNSITSLCKSDYVRGPTSLPWQSKENLKIGKTFLLSSHIKVKENLPSYQLLHHDLEDILVRCKDKLTTLYRLDAFYASLFLYDRYLNLSRVCPEINALHTYKGEVSLSIFDIHSFRGLPLSGCLYNEVAHTQWELTNKLPLSCIYLFTAYHKLMQGRKAKPSIEQWIAFRF